MAQDPDYRPIIDIPECPSNDVVVTASAHGLGISPATGKVVSELVLRGESSIDSRGLGRTGFPTLDQAGVRSAAGLRRPSGPDVGARH